MKIGIDARNLVPQLSGIGRYVAETSRHLAEIGHHVVLYLPDAPASAASIPSGVDTRIASYKGAARRVVWGNTRLPDLAKQDGLDIFWGPAHRLPILGALDTPAVLTIHDLVWLHASSTMRFHGWIGERIFMKRSIFKADRIVSVSSSTKSALSELYPSVKDRIDVVYPGCTLLKSAGSTGVHQRFNINRPYVLFVGTLEPRKNLKGLLAAFALLPDRIRSEHLLVIAGGQGWGREDIEAEAHRLGLTPNVRLTGFIQDNELSELYRSAKFLAMPSYYEGFGLPIIEANAAGIPVLTSFSSSMPEVGGDAAFLVDPSNITSIANGLICLATDKVLHSNLSSAAQANAARFDWRQSAQRLSRVFAAVLQNR